MASRPHLHERVVDWIADVQVRRPWLAFLMVMAVTLPALWGARGLGLRTDFAELLPENKPSVVEMRRVSKKLSSASTLTVVATGQDTQALKRFVDEAAPKIRALGPEWVGAVDDGVREAQQFFEQNKYLYAPHGELEKLRDEVVNRYDYEVGKASGLGDLGLDDEQPEPLTAESIRNRVEEARKKSGGAAAGQYPDGYYLGEDGHMIVMLVRTPVEGGSEQKAAALREKIDSIVASVNPQQLDPSMQVRYTGDFITSVEEYKGVKDDLANVGVWGVAMVLGVVLLFFLRVRVLLAIGLTIGVGLIWTFGATRLTVGYLNSSTGFLVSIIAGNGINFGIIYMARYLEARRVQQLAVPEAIRTAHRDTWLATLAAAGAAMVAYGSLAVTDFKGFKHFGFIGGMGMMLCWLGTYLVLPAILVVSERLSPMVYEPKSWRSRVHGFYGYLFAWLAQRFPRPIVLAAAGVAVIGTALTVKYVAHDPMEYDMHNLTNVQNGESSARALSRRADKIVGRMGQDGMAVMVDRVDQIAPWRAEMDKRLAAAAEDQKPFEKVVTAFDLLPDRQEEKLAMIGEIMDRLQRARAKGIISDKDWAELDPQLPKDLHALTLAHLPERMARSFTEADGTRGRIAYIVPKSGRSIWDAHYLELWADSFREVKLPSGEVIKGSGRAVIFADMIQAVRDDAPKAIMVSLLGTILVVLLAFRFRGASWGVLGTLMLGVVGLGAFLYLRGVKLNFLNFVALPITFGIGADYAVNMMKRFRIEPADKIREVVVETGGAVVLCSLTTVLGYVSLMFSMNQAIVSFGMTAAFGELTTLLAAVLVMPAAIVWMTKANKDRNSKPESAELMGAEPQST